MGARPGVMSALDRLASARADSRRSTAPTSITTCSRQRLRKLLDEAEPRACATSCSDATSALSVLARGAYRAPKLAPELAQETAERISCAAHRYRVDTLNITPSWTKNKPSL